MKKIFAFILASIMVLSLVPASAFAAITKEEACPDVHTVANCVEKVVYSKPATCEDNGYTIYECTKCGEQFIGSVVAGGEHVWVSDSDLADEDVKPDCTEAPKEYTNEDDEKILAIGKLHEICSECGATRVHYVTEAEYHAENGVWVSGVGCESTYECPVCEDTFNADGLEVGTHKGWELVEVLVKPVYTAGKKTSGLALFACTNDDCKATKKVEILAECDCYSILTGANGQVNFFKLVLAGKITKTSNAKDPTCLVDGKFAVYTCSDCNAIYRWETSNVKKPTTAPELAENEEGVEYVKGGQFVKITSTASDKYVYQINSKGEAVAHADETADKKYVMIKKSGHVADGKPLASNKCTNTYKCAICEEVYTKDEHNWLTHTEKLPTCESYGIIYKSCTVCGKDSSDVKKPLGHDIKTKTVASTCGSYGYTFSYCTHNGENDNKNVADEFKCSYYDKTYNSNVGKDNKDKSKAVSYLDPNTGIRYNDVRVGKKTYPIVSITPNTSYAGAHQMVIVDVIGGGTEGYCNSSSIVVEKCKVCNTVEYKQVAGAEHELVINKELSSDATCAAEGKIVKECKNCDYVDITFTSKLVGTHTTKVLSVEYVCYQETTVKFVVDNGSTGYLNMRDSASTTNSTVLCPITNGSTVTVMGSSDDGLWYNISYNGQTGWVLKAGVKAVTESAEFFTDAKTGLKYHGKRIVSCECGALVNKEELFDRVGESASNVWFDSVEEAKAYHGDGITTPVTSQKPSCDTNGYAIYKCEKCSVAIYVIDEADGHIPTSTKIEGKEPTCTAPGIADYYTCSVCLASIILKDAKWVKVTANELVLQPHSQATEKVYVEACDGSKTTYWQCKETDEDGNICGKYFEDQAATKPIDKLPEGKVHSWKVLYEGVTLTCNNDGYPSIRYCATCKTLERVQYVEALDENGKVVVKSGKDLLPDAYDFYLTKTVEEYEIPLYVNYVNGVITVSDYKVPKLSHGEAHKDDVPYYSDTVWANIFNHKYDVKNVICGEQDAYTIHKCLLCEYEYITGYAAAGEGHYNVYGELLEATCANYTLYSERRCVVCGEMVGADASIHNMAVKSAEDAEKYIEVEATCVSEGYVFNYCTNDGCLFAEVVSTTPVIPAEEYHTGDNLVSTNAQDYANNGDVIWTCKACGEVVKVDTAKDYNLPAGFEIYPSIEYNKYAVGSYIDVVISLDSLKGVDVWAFNFSVYFPYNELDFVGYEFNAQSEFSGMAHNETVVDTDYNDADKDGNTVEAIEFETGMVNIVVDSKAGVEVKGEQDLMVLTFKVVAKQDPRATQLPCFTVMKADAVAPNGKEVKVNANSANASGKFAITDLFDLNNDGYFTIADAYELYALIELGGYNVLGDVNGNGINDAFDLNELYQYLIGAKTAEEIIAGADADEEERVITYDENGNVTYDSDYDINEDGKLSAYEIAVMTGKIDPDLNPST